MTFFFIISRWVFNMFRRNGDTSAWELISRSSALSSVEERPPENTDSSSDSCSFDSLDIPSSSESLGTSLSASVSSPEKRPNLFLGAFAISPFVRHAAFRLLWGVSDVKMPFLLGSDVTNDFCSEKIFEKRGGHSPVSASKSTDWGVKLEKIDFRAKTGGPIDFEVENWRLPPFLVEGFALFLDFIEIVATERSEYWKEWWAWAMSLYSKWSTSYERH